MIIARVTGSVVATQKVASMTGHKLLTVEPYRVDGKTRERLVPTGRAFVVVDTLGAGVDEMVLICQGSSARLAPETDRKSPGSGIRGSGDSRPRPNRESSRPCVGHCSMSRSPGKSSIHFWMSCAGSPRRRAGGRCS
jgi:microcompartment protein CcmK/EutM